MAPTPRFDAAASRMLEGDDSLAAARELEAAVREDYAGDDRLNELRTALEGYAPDGTGLYCPAEVLRQQIEAAMVSLARSDAR